MGVSKQPPEQDVRASRAHSDTFSPVWLLNMVITYVSATLFLQQVLGTPGVVEQWRAEMLVPEMFHIVTSVTFGTAFLLDILAAAFYLDSSRLEFTLLPAWIKGAPFVSSVLMMWGRNAMTRSAAGKIVNLQRYICWMHTTPAVMYLIKSVSLGITSKQMWGIIVLHEVQLGMGAVAKLSGGYTEVILGVAVHAALVPVLWFLHRGLKDIGAYYNSNTIARFVYFFTLVTYASFGVVWDLDAFNLVTPAQEEGLYLFAEFASKVLFSTVLMFSNFKSAELRRIMVMRSIEVASQQQLIEQLKTLVDQKDQFLGAVSHELRTPLNGIIGLSEAALFTSDAAAARSAAPIAGPPPAIRLEPLAPSTKNQFALIRSSGLRLLHLVNDILDATALAHNRLVLQQQKVVLRPLCEEVADITRATLKPGVVLHCYVSDGLEVLGDQDRIVQVLNNLVRNAVKFTPKGSITLSAAYGVQQMPLPPNSSSSDDQQQQQRPVVSVSVSDTGYGIPADKLKAIFLPFEQVHPQESRSQRGLGLGLSIVHKLVTAMGGTITVSSSANRGSTFTFTLPAYAAGEERAAAAAAAAPAGVGGSSLGLMVPGSGSSVTSSSRGWSESARLLEPCTPTRSHSNAAAAAAAAAAVMAAAAKRIVKSPDLFRGINVERFKGSSDEERDLGPDTAAAAGGSSRGQQQQNSSPADSEFDDWPTAHASQRDVDQMFAAATAPSGGSSRSSAEATGSITCQQFYSNVNNGQRQLLVVDDDDTNHQVVSLLLGSAGYALIDTYSGAETLKYLTTCDVLPDMLLLDAAMPGMDGREVCRRVRSLMSDSMLHLPIVMLTAQVSAAAVDASIAAGADDHLGKPFSRTELMKVVISNLAKQKTG